MNQQYFITKQTANLMEDFAREIAQSSSIFLLYGEIGVGKTRLLSQLKSNRLSNTQVHWFDCSSQRTISHQPAEIEASDFGMRLQEIGNIVADGDVIIFDHYETAADSVRTQIFESWIKRDKTKQLNVIVSAASTSFDGFRQLAQQHQIEVRSYQLLGCTEDEVRAFILHSLYPDQVLAELSIPSVVLRRLNDCNGVYARLIEIIQHEVDSIKLATGGEEAKPDRHKYAGLLLLIIGSLVALYFAYPEFKLDQIESAKDKASNIQTDKQLLLDQSQEETEAVIQSLQQNREIVLVNQEVNETKPVPTALNDLPEKNTEQLIRLVDSVNVSSGSNLEPAAMIGISTPRDDSIDWFQLRLDESLNWIRDGDDQRGTIQIMSFGFDQLEQAKYKDYLESLETKNVDISQLKIFKTKAANQPVYSVIYGEYETRHQAALQIVNLPEVLKADQPISRSTGSILKEISQFEE